jgi:hypothetical protein
MEFYDQLRNVSDTITTSDLLLIMGDMNVTGDGGGETVKLKMRKKLRSTHVTETVRNLTHPAVCNQVKTVSIWFENKGTPKFIWSAGVQRPLIAHVTTDEKLSETIKTPVSSIDLEQNWIIMCQFHKHDYYLDITSSSKTRKERPQNSVLQHHFVLK